MESEINLRLNGNGTWEEDTGEDHPSLPPVDGGKDAWQFLAAAIVLEMLLWGFPWSYGIFQDFYSINTPFAGSANVASIGTTQLGTLYMAAPVTIASVAMFPRFRRPAIAIGLSTMCVALGLSSLCNSVPQLVVTQGILYGLGGALAYSPVIYYLEEWFVARRGFAYGAVWAGTGLGGVIIPLLLQFLLNRYGFRTALRVWAVLLFCISIPLVWVLKPRLPIPATSRVRLSLKFLKDPTFWVLQTGSALQGFGFFMPSLYLPAYASKLGYDSNKSALTIVLINVFTMIGSLIMGIIIDRWHVATAILLSSLGSAISIFLIWGFSTSLAPLLTFCVMYGLFAGPFTTTWPGIVKAVQQSTGHIEGAMIFAFLSLGRGVGNILSGPLSEALIRTPVLGNVGTYGTQYGSLVVFTGMTAVLGSLGMAVKKIQ